MFIVVLLYGKDKLIRLSLSDGEEICFGENKKNDMILPGFGDASLRLRMKKGAVYASAKKISDLRKTSVKPSDGVQIISHEYAISLLVKENVKACDASYKLPYRGIVTIGRSEDNSIQISDGVVSRHHLILRCENGEVHLQDGYQGQPSSNGTYVNGRLSSGAVVRSGDTIDIMHIRMTLINSELYFETVDGKAPSFSGPEESRSSIGAGNGHLVYRRSPRTREQLPNKEVVLDRPPMRVGTYEKRRGTYSSLIGSGAMVGASLAMGAVSPALLAARAASLVSPVSNIITGKGGDKKEKKRIKQSEQRRLEKYAEYAEGQQAVILQVADKQREIIGQENPDPRRCMNILSGLERSLWERTPADTDFLKVRSGLGYESLCVPVKKPGEGNEFHLEEDEAEELVRTIIENTRIVDNIPSRIDLRTYQIIGLTGQRSKVIDLVRNMIVCLTTAHFYKDVRIVGIFDEEEKEQFLPLRWLPHLWDEEGQTRYLAFSSEEAEKISDVFHDVLRSRQYESADNGPHYIFLLGSQRLVEHTSMMDDLLSCNPAVRATSILFYRHENYSSEQQLYWLPKECQFIIDVDGPFGTSAYDVAQINNKFIFTPDAPIPDEQFDEFCRTMSAIEVLGDSLKQDLPDGISFLKGFKIQKVEELNAWERWCSNSAVSTLRTPVGVKSDGKPFYLDAVKHGPHGLAAGTTGSGKSEFLASWILSMAVNYHPQDVNFLVIDYKGGSLANTLEGLPHVVGKITNIGQNIHRSMASVKGELVRRQRIFADCGVNDISAYQKGYKEGRFSEPLPRLLLVSDEFAELKTQEPEFLKALVGTARIGRNLGIHLMLATQEPNGVVDDQIRNNSNFQVCLKVANAASSRAMITRPDAALIKQPGRAIIRVGMDEIYEMVQTYWSGARYIEGNHKTADINNKVKIVDLNGQRTVIEQEKDPRAESALTELQVISRYLRDVAKEKNIAKSPGLWKPELPLKLYLDQLGLDTGFREADWRGTLDGLEVPIGLFDIPEEQAQGRQSIDFEKDGHYGIFGISGSGKTSLLRTIITSTGIWHTPNEINLYVLDFGSGSLKAFERMPHVGAVVMGYEDEKVKALSKMIREMIDERKSKFGRYSVSSLSAYHRAAPGDQMPAVVFVIDNIVPVFTEYPEFEDFIYDLTQNGSSYGVYLLFTANNITGIRYKILQNIHGMIAFELNEKSDYSSIVGRVENAGLVTGMKGRGFIHTASAPVMFHAALPAEGDSEVDLAENLKKLFERMGTAWREERAKPLPIMPETIDTGILAKFFTDKRRVPIGFAYDSMSPAYLDFNTTCAAMVTGSNAADCLQAIRPVLAFMGQSHYQYEMYGIDSEDQALHNACSGFARIVSAHEADAVSQLLKGIVEELIGRQEKGSSENDKPILLVVNDLPDFTQIVSDASWKMLRSIIVNGKDLGMMVIVTGAAAAISTMSVSDPLVTRILSAGLGLAVSGPVSAHGFYKGKAAMETLNTQIDNEDAFLFSNDTATRVKRLQG